MSTKQFTAKWVNNPGKSKAGRTYYNIKAEGDEDTPYWAKAGVLDGISAGDIVECEFRLDEKGGRNIIKIEGKSNGAGKQLKSYRQNESPNVVDGKCIHGLVVAFIGSQLVALDADAIARAYKICADGYHRKGSMGSSTVQSGPRDEDNIDLDDEIPFR